MHLMENQFWNKKDKKNLKEILFGVKVYKFLKLKIGKNLIIYMMRMTKNLVAVVQYFDLKTKNVYQ